MTTRRSFMAMCGLAPIAACVPMQPVVASQQTVQVSLELDEVSRAFLAGPMSAADRLAFGTYTAEERAVLADQVAAGIPAEEVEAFWQDHAFQPVTPHRPVGEFWADRNRSSSPASAASPDRVMISASPLLDGGAL